MLLLCVRCTPWKKQIRTLLTEALPAVVDKHLPPVTPHPFFRLPQASTPVAGGVGVAAPAPVDEALALLEALERAISILAAERTEPDNAEEIDERLWRLSLDWRQLCRQWTATVAIDTSGSE